MFDMNTPPLYIGIDPGTHGGIAVLCEDKVKLQALAKFETFEQVWSEAFAPLANHTVFAVLEKVGGYVPIFGQKGKGANGAPMFNFGRLAGMVEAYLAVLKTENPEQVHYTKIIPTVWQEYLSLKKQPSEKKSSSKWKNRLKDKAKELYPRVNITLDTADALLLAHYCKFLYGAKRLNATDLKESHYTTDTLFSSLIDIDDGTDNT